MIDYDIAAEAEKRAKDKEYTISSPGDGGVSTPEEGKRVR